MKYSYFPDKFPNCFTSLSSITFLSPLLLPLTALKPWKLTRKTKTCIGPTSCQVPATSPQQSLFPLFLDSYPQLVFGLFWFAPLRKVLFYSHIWIYSYTDGDILTPNFPHIWLWKYWLWIFLMGVQLGSTDNKS